MAQLMMGDGKAFQCVLNRHAKSIHAFVFRLCGNRTDAEDLVQETFLRLWQHADQWRPGTVRLTTWLHRIARNLSIDSFRQNNRRPPINAAIEPSEEPSASDPAQEEILIQMERQSAVRKWVTRLPERQRTALILCQYQGMSNREAAAVLEVSIDALESLLSRARRALRQKLSAYLTGMTAAQSAGRSGKTTHENRGSR